MAEEEKQENEDQSSESSEEEGSAPSPEQKKKKKKKLMVFGGGFLGILLAGWIAATMAVPGEEVVPTFEGPFVGTFSEEEGWEIQVNLNGGGGHRFLVMSLVAEYFAYDEAYFAARIADTHFQRFMKSELIGLASQKSDTDVLDPAANAIFMEEIRALLDPIVFPVHLGDAKTAFEGDSKSGLLPGPSQIRSDFRGPFHEHHLAVDGPQGTLQLDDGPSVPFAGTETDLRVRSSDGGSIYVDVTELDPTFVGDVRVGVHGRIRMMLKDKFLVQ